MCELNRFGYPATLELRLPHVDLNNCQFEGESVPRYCFESTSGVNRDPAADPTRTTPTNWHRRHARMLAPSDRSPNVLDMFKSPNTSQNAFRCACCLVGMFQLNFSMSTEDGASTKRQKAHAMLGQLREGNGADGGEGGGTEGWEEVRVDGVPRVRLAM